MSDNRNFILAIALSIAVLFGWQYFVAGPQLAKQQPQEQTAGGAAKAPAPGPSTVPQGAPTAPAATPATPATTTAFASRDEALASSPRILIASAAISGSVNLRGARIDDLHLVDYRVTTDPASPPIVLLSPSGIAGAYFGEFGFSGAGGIAVPGPDTLWSAPADAVLSPTAPLDLSYDNGAGLIFHRKISIDQKYMFTFVDSVENKSSAPVSLASYGRIARFGEPSTAEASIVLHIGPIGVFGDQGQKTASYSDIKKAKETAYAKATKGWIGLTDKYWAVTLVPDQAAPFTGRFIHAEAAEMYQADMRTDATTIAAGSSATFTNRLFAGAKEVPLLNSYRDEGKIEKFDLLINWGILYFLTQPLFHLIDWLFRLFGNFGVAILAVTVLVKAAFFPLANRSYKSMSKMRQLQPQIQALRERYADDKVKAQQAQMELFKREKINPVAGCWPVLVQIPVFFSLYSVLYINIEMRQAPFFGWIKDLSAPDPTTVFNLFGLIPWQPPGFLMLGAWPIVMGVTMWLQMRLNPSPPDPAQRIVFNWMPVIFTYMLASFPAGLVIYWAWNNALSILQQTVIMRRQGVKVDLLDNVMASLGLKAKPPAQGGTG
ncbi:MAG: membrane protein insertase YidC [Bauldia sp.]